MEKVSVILISLKSYSFGRFFYYCYAPWRVLCGFQQPHSVLYSKTPLYFEKFRKTRKNHIEKLDKYGYIIVEKFCEVSHHAET